MDLGTTCFLAHLPPMKFIAHLQVQNSPEILEPILKFNKININSFSSTLGFNILPLLTSSHPKL